MSERLQLAPEISVTSISRNTRFKPALEGERIELRDQGVTIWQKEIYETFVAPAFFGIFIKKPFYMGRIKRGIKEAKGILDDVYRLKQLLHKSFTYHP
ncbi:hypothetical protein HYT33_04140 [Candidatus Roizmanbacteria bacterium]|nr:hypothetical protein [Candidatus Roizmanbacteria bacterium]